MKPIVFSLLALAVFSSFVEAQQDSENSIYQGCNQTIYEGQGIIVSPNYPYAYDPNSFCTWLINVEEGRTVQLRFRYFDVEHTRNCMYDAVEIYNGPATSYPKIGKFCGPFRPGRLESTSNKMLISLKTDDSNSNLGFVATFISAQQQQATPGSCGGLLTSYSGKFTSVNYPKSNYPMEQTCTWHVLAPRGRQVVLSFRSFKVEQSNGCTYDAMVVYGGQSDASDLQFLGRFCGNEIPAEILSPGNELFVTFISDASGNDAGFEVDYISLEPIPQQDPVIQDDHLDEPICADTFILETNAGEFKSPEIPASNTFRDEMLCSWLIVATPKTFITLTFNEINMEQSQNCARSYVAVFEGIASNPSPIGRFCGSMSNVAVNVSSNQMFVTFHAANGDDTASFAAQFSATVVPREVATTTATVAPTTTTTTAAAVKRRPAFECPAACPRKAKIAPSICKSENVLVLQLTTTNGIYTNGVIAIVQESIKGSLAKGQEVLVTMPCKKCRQKIKKKGQYLYAGNTITQDGKLYIVPGNFAVRFKAKKHNRAIAKAMKRCK